MAAGGRKVQPLGASCSGSSDTSSEFGPVSAPPGDVLPGRFGSDAHILPPLQVSEFVLM